MYIPTSVPVANAGTSPGAYKAKVPNVAIALADDIAVWPSRDSKGVKLTGNYVLKPGKQHIRIYMTPETIDASFEVEGPEDGKVFKNIFKGEHPGEELAIREFIQNNLGKGFIIFEESCRNTGKIVYGTKCSPMKLSPTFTSNKEGTKHMLTFEQPNPVEFLPAYYDGTLTDGTYKAVSDEKVALAKADGLIYQLGGFAVTDDIDILSSDLDHGSIVTLLGGGGAAPATLSTGAATAGTVALVSGTQWVALSSAYINLRVFKAGATTYFIEESRG